MLRRLDPETTKFMTDLADINRRLSESVRRVTSGRRINTISDVPDELTNLLQIRAELKQTEQIRSNLGRVKTEVDSAEQALQAAVSVMERAAVLGTQAGAGVIGAGQRDIIAEEVENLIEQMVGLTRTTVEARFIFSGNSDSQAPFTVDISQPDPVSGYQGSAATREVMHPSGTLFPISRNGEEVFDNPDPGKNVFDALTSLRNALRANDEEAVRDSLSGIQSAATHLNNQLAYYGSVQNQVAEATNFALKQEVRLKTRLAAVEDADLGEAILTLKEAQYQQEVALNAKAKVGKSTLFDYLG